MADRRNGSGPDADDVEAASGDNCLSNDGNYFLFSPKRKCFSYDEAEVNYLVEVFSRTKGARRKKALDALIKRGVTKTEAKRRAGRRS